MRVAGSGGLTEANLGRGLGVVAQSSRRQLESERGVVALLEGAATADAEVARMGAGWKDDRARSLRTVAEGLETQLRPGLDANDAGAMIRALTGSEVYRELVVGEGWSGDKYEQWLNGLLRQLLVHGGRPVTSR